MKQIAQSPLRPVPVNGGVTVHGSLPLHPEDFPWTNSHPIADDLRTGVQKLNDATPDGVLLCGGKLATELDRLARSPCTTGARADSERGHVA